MPADVSPPRLAEVEVPAPLAVVRAAGAGVTLCRTCADSPAKVADQCRACYVYARRTGEDRSDYLARLEGRREEARRRAWLRLARQLQITGV
jgi:hypothetical protein